MLTNGKTVVVIREGNGIGAALAWRFAAEAARNIILTNIDAAAAKRSRARSASPAEVSGR
jgi:NAD(P)-dependent dehydrogenase (short-subunit alcohol dehydrogenase family)